MGLFGALFGKKSKKIGEFMDRDAVILDVRTPSEYKEGAIRQSKNIPVQELTNRINEVKQWEKPVICCCASGVRSETAAKLLRKHGIEAINGGGWIRLQAKK